MSFGMFSQTAILTATCRAAHQILDAPPRILNDPVALKFVDDATAAALRNRDPALMAIAFPQARVHFCLRSRVAEDCLERAITCGVDQYVVLGAGLDSFAYRQPHWAKTVKIVEVDHPRTQEFKINSIKSRGLLVPQNVVYASVDFVSDPLTTCLTDAGIDADRPVFVSWLGVSQYLVSEVVSNVLRALASWPGGCGLVATYMLADWSNFAPKVRERFEWYRQWAASIGEPWLSRYSQASMAELLRSSGFAFQKSFAVSCLQSQYFARRTDGLRPEGGPSWIMGAHTSPGHESWFDLRSRDDECGLRS